MDLYFSRNSLQPALVNQPEVTGIFQLSKLPNATYAEVIFEYQGIVKITDETVPKFSLTCKIVCINRI